MSEPRSTPCPAMRIVVGRLYVGGAPWFDCSWCGTFHDTAEFDSCPICAYEITEQERAHWAAIKRDAVADKNGTHVQIMSAHSQKGIERWP